jgi:hypothetical protein
MSGERRRRAKAYLHLQAETRSGLVVPIAVVRRMQIRKRPPSGLNGL